MAGPLPAGLLAYHVYLIWAGMTTNESSKWADLRDDVADGLVWKARRVDVLGQEEREREENTVTWPVRGQWVVVATKCGEMPGSRGRQDSQNRHVKDGGVVVLEQGHGHSIWEKVTSLAEMENVYDLGFRENLRDTFFNRD